MKRGMKEFFRKNQYRIAAVCIVAAIIGVIGIYSIAGGRSGREEEKQETALQEDTEEKTVTAKNEPETEEKEEAEAASAVVKPKQRTGKLEIEERNKEEKEKEKETGTSQTADAGTNAEPEEENSKAEEVAEAKDTAEGEETLETAAEPAAQLHFDADTGLNWPVSGAVILNYSMDKTVYFATLNQYKYNPAVIIAGNVNEKVKAAASGKIIDISTNEVTGCTVTMDLGDGYTAIYGQLKEVPYKVGAYVEAGNTIGFISEPTKYYSLEGSNLYFGLQKDHAPIDPVEYFAAE